MKVCIFGAGAIGGYLAVELARSGAAEVTCIARGPHLAAMKANGLKLRIDGEERVAEIACTDDPAEAGPQDFVIVTLKAHSAAAVADRMAPLLGPDTAVVTAQNGVPWWYFYKFGGDLEGTRLATADPGNRQWDLIGPQRAIGCIVYPAAEIVEPGIVRHDYGNRFTIGEPDGGKSERIQALAGALSAAGLRAPVRPRIRDEIWIKLWGNLSFNPISALTHATLEGICRHPLARELAVDMMREAQAVAEQLGVVFKVSLDQRVAGAAAVGAHKTSMLRDVELGRPLELEALVGSVVELGRITGTPTPAISAIYAATALLAQTLTDAHGRLEVQARR